MGNFFMLKKYMFGIVLFAFLVIPKSSILANNNILENFSDYEIELYAEEYGITVDELINFEDNFRRALQELENIQTLNNISDNENVITIPVSENLNLQVSTSHVYEIIDTYENEKILSESDSGNSFRNTITARMDLQNIFGWNVVTLNSVGVFITDGRTSRPVDAYGNHSATVWNVTNTSSSMGPQAFNAWARSSFQGEFNFGVDPISITIRSFGTTGTVNCNANRVVSSSWS